MSYTPPNALALNAVWSGLGGYVAPTAIAADASWYLLGQGSPLGAPSITLFSEATAIASAPSMMQAPSFTMASTIAAQWSSPGPMGVPTGRLFHDWTQTIGATVQTYYECEITGAPAVRVPISSWQATIQTGRQSYVQAVIPAVADYVDILTARPLEEFVIYKVARYSDGNSVEQEMARAPMGEVRIDRGPSRHTATLAGYVNYVPPPIAGGGPVLQSPAHYWPLNEASGTTITDSITLQDGSVLNDPTSTTASAAGKFSGSRNLGATTAANGRSHLRLWSGAEDMATVFNEWGLSCWVKRDSTVSASFFPELFNFGNYRGDQNTIYAYTSKAGDQIFVDILNEAGTTVASVNSAASASIFGGGWHNIAISGSALGVFLYIDGVQSASILTPALSIRTKTNVSLFGGSDVTSFCDYEVDDIAIFDYPLTASQVAFIWNGGAGRTANSQDADPNVIPDSVETTRTLTGIRSLSQYGSVTRVRSDIDWLLRPGMTALAAGHTLNVAYINYYVSGNQAYMDVGERAI